METSPAGDPSATGGLLAQWVENAGELQLTQWQREFVEDLYAHGFPRDTAPAACTYPVLCRIFGPGPEPCPASCGAAGSTALPIQPAED